VSDVVVLGAGVIGLSTASALLDRGLAVEVWFREDVQATTSAVAGAIWQPYLVEPRDRVLGWAAVGYRVLQELAQDPATGVRMVRVVEVLPAGAPIPEWMALVPGARRIGADEVPDGCAGGAAAEVPLCETPVYLPWLRARVAANGARFVRREAQDLAEGFAAAEVVVNCTGLGARELCGDRALRAARGQVVCVENAGLHEALLDESDAKAPVYLLPRSGDVVLGGTVGMDDERLAVDAADTASIMQRCARLWAGARGAKVRAVKVGLRPWRPQVRLEAERHGDRLVVHNYGHGGAGFTLAWGCAAEVAGLVAGGARPAPER
jgi:D-amino-acid oxidase